MNTTFTQINIIKNVLDTEILIRTSELIIYSIMFMIIGYIIHYIFSSRRDYFRTPKKNPKFFYENNLNYTNYYKQDLPIKQKEYNLETDIITNIKDEIKYWNPLNNSKDDLKVIEGIGPKIELILNKAKINTWYRLSKTNIDKLKSILESAGNQYNMHDPSTWPEQAYLAETRQWEQLKRLQNKLNGGKYI